MLIGAFMAKPYLIHKPADAFRFARRRSGHFSAESSR
jgi:hypothetical protein